VEEYDAVEEYVTTETVPAIPATTAIATGIATRVKE